MSHTERLTSQEVELRHQIGDLIRRQRRSLDYSEEYLAKLVGFQSKKPIWLIETGRMPIPADKLLKLATSLRIDPHELLLLECRARLLCAGFDLQAMLHELAGQPTTPGVPAAGMPNGDPLAATGCSS